MLGDFITRGLVMVLGYAYPAFECFKTVEKNKVEIEELRFWCQYWILVAALTVFERIGDIFLSWLPMYGEMKLGLFIYLWYPKTKGTSYVYGTFFRPYIASHEEDIDRKLQELRARIWDIILNYWQSCAIMGQTSFFQILNYMASQSAKVTTQKQQHPNKEDHKKVGELVEETPTVVVSPTTFENGGMKHRQFSDKRRPPISTNGDNELAAAAGVEEGDSGLLNARSRLRRSKGIQTS
ncbi:putative HVA22-like protein g [Impatiens glandulifera]|uniref:putative HVA22-like protein g n=1 Tax=Impatiens glandulifera TaxID=253017 RepID=UPI001FB04D1B|nr:putative HVA22-like protein g [Impatiens glandulifera]